MPLKPSLLVIKGEWLMWKEGSSNIRVVNNASFMETCQLVKNVQNNMGAEEGRNL